MIERIVKALLRRVCGSEKQTRTPSNDSWLEGFMRVAAVD